MRIAGLGTLALCALLSLTACSTTGNAPSNQRVVFKDRIVEVPVEKLVEVPAQLTAYDPLPPPPVPAVPFGPLCQRKLGCLSPEQLDAMLRQALHAATQRGDHLDEIRRLGAEAKAKAAAQGKSK
ncbi:MAG TPA: hypothetical protein VFE72_02815 [Lysobacter sp.]|nr:hypothetical protein [Lysobacter sp.]